MNLIFYISVTLLSLIFKYVECTLPEATSSSSSEGPMAELPMASAVLEESDTITELIEETTKATQETMKIKEPTKPKIMSVTKLINVVGEHTTEYSTYKNVTMVPSPPSRLLYQGYWMTKMGDIREDLLRVQAMIVKDEEVYTACNEGQQKSQRRFLMCAGSILNRNSVLTSASCLHETLHIRHNVRGPLSVVIAPLKSSVQVIRVAEYRIHPRHMVYPKSPDHATHNVAILSLSCRISDQNYYKVQLPNKPHAHYCTEWNCFIALITKTGYSSNVMSQIAPPLISWDRQRRSVINETVRRITKRSSDGTENCAQTGSAVMLNDTQTGIVAVSCDDRQPSSDWLYTDVYKNVDWINQMLTNWNSSEQIDNNSRSPTNTSTLPSKSCGNCVFNFYISVGCKGKSNCPNGMRRNINPSNSTINAQDSSSAAFRSNWPQNKPDLWNSQVAQPNDIFRPLRSSLKTCPNNSPECLRFPGRTIIPVQRIRSNIDLINRNKMSKNPIVIKTRNQSLVNVSGKYNAIYQTKGRINSKNRTWLNEKMEYPMKTIDQNIHIVKKPNNRKIVNSDMGNWLRRRHVNF